MSDRGLTWEEAMEFDRLQYASILKEKKQAEEKCPRCGGDGFVTKYACVTTRRVACPACLGGKNG